MGVINLLTRIKRNTRRIALTVSSLLTLLIEERLYNPFKKLTLHNNKASVKILANGPSLKDFLNQIDNHEVDLVKDDYCVVNDFVHDRHFETIKPKYAVLSDPLYFIETIYSERGRKAMNAYADKVKWPMSLIITYNYKDSDFLDPIKHNSNISLIVLHNTRIKGDEIGLNRIFKSGYGNGQFGTVALNAIYTMIQIGYKNIYMYGTIVR